MEKDVRRAGVLPRQISRSRSRPINCTCVGPSTETKLYRRAPRTSNAASYSALSHGRFCRRTVPTSFQYSAAMKQAVCAFLDLPPQSTEESLDPLGPTTVINQRHLTFETFDFGLGLAMSREHASPLPYMTSSHLTCSSLPKT